MKEIKAAFKESGQNMKKNGGTRLGEEHAP
jgi:hypothetical protein